jgi:hypothetical protein
MIEAEKDLQEVTIGIIEVSEVIGDRVFIPEIIDALKTQQQEILYELEDTMSLQGQGDGMPSNSIHTDSK